MLAIGHDELGEPIGETVVCYVCGGTHPVEWATRLTDDGMRVETRSLGFARCTDGHSYLVAVDGRAWRP